MNLNQNKKENVKNSTGQTKSKRGMKKNASDCGLVGYADIKHRHSAGNNNWVKFSRDHDMPCFPKEVVEGKQEIGVEYSNGKEVTKAVALDCEMVGVGEDGREDMLARVSIVNSHGDTLYDTFVKPTEAVVDYRTEVSGVRPCDMETGKDFDQVQKDVAHILKKRILVGHSLKSDFSVLSMSHPKWLIRDTSKFFKEPGKGTPSLKKLASTHLGATIQVGEHDSVQDALAAMNLYIMFRKFWERGRGNKNRNTYSTFLREARAKTTA